MDYLKCIVIKYLVKPPGSSERTALLPVLATLLQFDSNEPLRKGSTSCHKVSWSGLADEHPAPMLPPSSQTIPPAPTSAEVTVSNNTPPQQNSAKKTSLQF